MLDSRLEQATRRFLEPGPTELSQASLDVILRAVHETPQRHEIGAGWREHVTPRAIGRLALAAVLLLALLLGLTLAGQQPTEPRVTERDDAPPVVAFGSVPTTIDNTWTRAERRPGAAPIRWTLNLGTYAHVTNSNNDPWSMAMPNPTPAIPIAIWLGPVAGTTDELLVAAPDGGVCAGVQGRYRWSLDTDEALRLEAVDDTCAERTQALTGAWHREATGALEPGVYAYSQFVRPFRFRAPAGVTLVDQQTWSPQEIVHLLGGQGESVLVWAVGTRFRDPCRPEQLYEPLTGGVRELVELYVRTAGLRVTTSSARIAGQEASAVDVEAVGSEACSQWVFWTVGSTTQHDWFRTIRGSHWIAEGSRERTVITEIDGQVVAVAVQAPSATFDEWRDSVEPLIDSITFEAPADGG